ncbi:MAG: hypothetical protein LAP86_23360 [Acidobacteriia bacterium]|nr:hypothetical protein [Terriglobia bacterium]
MLKLAPLFACLSALFVSSAFAGVNVSSPTNGSTVQSPVLFKATAGGTSCSKGVASMGVYSAPGVLAYVTNGTVLDTHISLGPGTHQITVEQWDYCGGASATPITLTVASGSGVYISSPANNTTVGSPVRFTATASTTCSKGVSAMGIYTGPYQKAYTVSGASLNTDLTLASGTYDATVVEWDNCGGASSAPVKINVSGGGKSFTNVQAHSGWSGHGELPPKYAMCSSCPGLGWSMSQGISSPAMDGKATKYSIYGTTPYADVLWNKHLIGDGSSEGLPDYDHSLTPSLHNFTYDAYFYGTDLSLSENIEFDIGQFVGGTGLMFGTQCQIVNGHVWGIWDNIHGKWVSTNVPCKPANNTWNHITLQFQRTSDNQLIYKSITLNGVTTTLNAKYAPYSVPNWWGVVINFQLDGNYKLADYSVYLDKVTVTYN